jgi:hypothetical protein
MKQCERHVGCRCGASVEELVTSKNIKNRPGPEPQHPPRPASSPHEDRLVSDNLADPPPASALADALKAKRTLDKEVQQ